jgi:alpha-tubulin suppressor-like RCC1 family protein
LLDPARAELTVFGDNKNKQLDLAAASDVCELATTVHDPVTVDPGQKVLALTCGWTHVALLNQKSEVWTIGRNSYGQLGR